MAERYEGIVVGDGEGGLRAIPDGDTGSEERYLDADHVRSLRRVRFVPSGRYSERTHHAETEHPRWNPDPAARLRGEGVEREERVEGVQRGHYEYADDEPAAAPRRPWEAP